MSDTASTQQPSVGAEVPPQSIFYVDDDGYSAASTTTVVAVEKDACSNKSASYLLTSCVAPVFSTASGGAGVSNVLLTSEHSSSNIPTLQLQDLSYRHDDDAFVSVLDENEELAKGHVSLNVAGDFSSHRPHGVCCVGGGCGVGPVEDATTTSSFAAYKNVGIALLVVLLGLLEGYLFAHSGLYAPTFFVLQMRFERFLLLKVFVSGVGSSMLAQALMAAFHVKQFEKSRSYRQENNGWLQVVGGCGLLGVGMAMSGSGPTMLPTQIGVGVETAGMVLVGCLTGGALYSIFERFFSFRIDVSRHISDKVVVEDLVHAMISAERIHSIQQSCTRLHLYQVLAVPMGTMMIGFAFIVDYLSPHSADAEMVGLAPYSLTSSTSDISSSSRMAQIVFFHPITAGIIIGVNQIPLRVIQDDGQGGSTAIMNMVSYVSSGKLSTRHNIKSWKQATQIIYVYVGTLIGAILGFMEIGITTHTSPGMLRIAALGDSHWTPWRVFLGGLFMVFGARVAGGCTCGHGISGVSELSLQSFAGAGAIFGCGIAITFAIGL